MSQAFLKCDAESCDHIETVPAISREFIGMPCPKCGANLLTDKDCEDWLAAIQPGIDVMKAVGLFVDGTPEGQPVNRVRVHLHDCTMTVSPIKTAEAKP